MKKASIFLTAALIFILTVSLQAQDVPKKTKVSVHANLNFPVGDFDQYDLAIGFAGMIEHQFFPKMPELALTASVHLVNFDMKSNDDYGKNVNDQQFQTFGIKAGALYYFLYTETFELFAGADLGVYLTKGLRTYYQGVSYGGSGDEAEGRFGFSPVVGMDYILSPSFSINGQLRYSYLTSVESRVTQEGVGVSPEIAPTFFSIYVGIAMMF